MKGRKSPDIKTVWILRFVGSGEIIRSYFGSVKEVEALCKEMEETFGREIIYA